MPSVYPNTTIYLLADVPLDITYRNTLTFANSSAQYEYFASKMLKSFTDTTYQRYGRNKMRLQCYANDVITCNYLMFQNNYTLGDGSHRTKWFYGFITNIEYINNVTTEITWDLDVMQTWWFDHHFNYCFVERETPDHDDAGDNILEEGIEYGDYVIDDKIIPSDDTGDYQLGWNFCVIASFDKNLQDAVGERQGVVYSGLCYNYFDYSEVDELNNFLLEVTQQNKQTGIVAIIQIPDYIRNSTTHYGSIGLPDSLDGYVPECQKLWCYPYVTYVVTDGSGNSAEFKPQYCEVFGQLDFQIFGSMGGAIPEGAFTPRNYGFVNGSTLTTNDAAMLVTGNFPQCAYTIDGYLAWYAQNGYRYETSLTYTRAKGVANTLSGGVSNITRALSGSTLEGIGAILDTIQGGITDVGNVQALLAEKKDHETLPPQYNTSNSTSLGVNSSTKCFTIYRQTITRQYAISIDQYFKRYGYTVNRVKIPIWYERPHWNYLKTRGCTLNGDVPASDMAQLERIYDNGITIWKNPSEVGDYSLDNSPGATPT